MTSGIKNSGTGCYSRIAALSDLFAPLLEIARYPLLAIPMIFSIHGGGGTPEGMINIADFRTIADRDKVV